MANTLQNLFPLTNHNPDDFNIYPVYVKFSAPVIGGKYVFSPTTTPAQAFGDLLQPQAGVIAGVMVSANCDAAQFTAALDEPLFLQILHGGNKTPVNMRPFPFSDFSQADNFQLQWKCSGGDRNQQEKFLLQITGSVNQLTGMTNNELVLRVSFNFIRVGLDKLEQFDFNQKIQRVVNKYLGANGGR